jgi:hypothetical protein
LDPEVTEAAEAQVDGSAQAEVEVARIEVDHPLIALEAVQTNHLLIQIKGLLVITDR